MRQVRKNKTVIIIQLSLVKRMKIVIIMFRIWMRIEMNIRTIQYKTNEKTRKLGKKVANNLVNYIF